MIMKEIKTIELFAGVGGFRVGLNRVNEKLGQELFKTVWSNQWEPATKTQHASRTYVRVFGSEGHVNEDIAKVCVADIPDHDLLVGGFPCQDYSVARTLSQAKGLEGKKGVLWWQIARILEEKGEKKPSLLLLENVDRLIGSPAKQRGRDFAIILQSLADLGYIAEWRIINAADYGMPQRRRRIYIIGYQKDSLIAKSIQDPTEWIFQDGVFATAFPVEDYSELYPLIGINIKSKEDADLADITESFNKNNKIKPFANAGLMINGIYYTYATKPIYHGPFSTIADIMVQGEDRKYITDDYYIREKDLPKWEYLKGGKNETRKTKEGFEFQYNEGSMVFPDPLDKPSRTIITSEGGVAPSRFKHVIMDPVEHRLRRLVPIELERLDMFPDNHTEGESDTKRAFFMGNALVCGIVTKIGEEFARRLRLND